jgi:hypothetical protein
MLPDMSTGGNLAVAAVDRFPELRKLRDLVDANSAFRHWYDKGTLVKVTGLYQWPGGFVDTVRVGDTTDAAGMRCDHSGEVLWELDGGLVEVVDGLLTLPAPVHPRRAPAGTGHLAVDPVKLVSWSPRTPAGGGYLPSPDLPAPDRVHR